ncbi:MAG: hypothetical protein JWO73_36 [Candidatus Taylorbacteria bacterium]|nr:hypothetical protein [Candidatus Taylorbacteria bacterium]
MKRHLENLRAKPDHVKRNIAFGTSLGITAIIFVFWVVSLTVQAPSVSASNDDALAKVESPFSSMSASVGDAWSSIKDVLSAYGKGTSQPANALEVVPGSR